MLTKKKKFLSFGKPDAIREDCRRIRGKWAEEVNNIHIANKHIQRRSTSLVIRETQIKTTVRCHFTATRVTAMKQTDNNKC